MWAGLDSKISEDPFLPDGASALNVPRHQAGLLTIYRTSLCATDDLSLALALRYVGRRAASLDPEQLALKLDGYVRIDAFATWRLAPHVEVHMSLENITDDDYIQGSQSDAFSLSPGAPFTVRGALSLSW